MVRCFIAIYPVKSERVYEMQEKIGKLIEGKGVEKENMHITLSFLGEKVEEEIKEIKKRLKEVAGLCYKRIATLTKIKFIPNEKFFRVIAIDVAGLDDLSEMIEKKVGGNVKPPHLTLFRVKNVKNREELLEFKKVEINENVPVERICLMKSTLTHKGPIYEVIDSFELKSYQ
jgi:2'-5' RNA ligase